MAEPATVYLHDGRTTARIGELTDVASVDRSYEENGGGAASVSMGPDDPLLRETDPGEGNLVVIDGAAYPVPWVGYVQGWTRSRGEASDLISLRCRGYAELLKHRLLNGEATLTGSVQGVFRQVIDRANGANPTGIEAVAGSASPIAFDRRAPFTVSHETAFDALDRLAELVGWSWWVGWSVSSERIRFRAYLAPGRGRDAFGIVTLSESGNVEVEESTIDLSDASQVVVVLGGATHAVQSLADLPVQRLDYDPTPLPGPHGYVPLSGVAKVTPTNKAEELILAEELRSQGLVNEAAKVIVGARRARPERRVGISCTDPGTWPELEVGSVYSVQLPSAFVDGHDGPARLLGVEAREGDGRLELVLGLLERKTPAHITAGELLG